MKKLSRVLTLFLAVIFAMSAILTGCGGNTSSDQKTVIEDSANSNSDVQKLDPVTLTMVIPGVPQKDQGLVNDAVSKYLKDSLNVTLDLQVIDWSTWTDKNNLIIASGENCDVLFSANWCGFSTNASKGAFVDMTDLLKTKAPGIMNSKYTWVLEAGKFDNKIYGIPGYQQTAQGRGFYIRKDIADKYKFEVKDVNTFEDLEPILKIAKEKEGLVGFHGTPGHLLSFMGPWDQQGDTVTAIDCSSGEAKWLNLFETDLYKKSAEVARRWFVNGYVNADIATTKEDDKAGLNEGKIFSYGCPTNIELGGYKYPLKMYRIVQPILSTGSVQGALFVIPRQSQNPERAMMLIDKMHTDAKLDNMLVYGIEGTHFVLKDGKIVEDIAGVTAETRTYRLQNWIFGNEALVYPTIDEDPNLQQILDEFNQNAIKSPALGFVYDPSKMKNEIAALENIKLEFDPVISSGVTDAMKDGHYEKFLAKLKAAGIDRLIADKQAQLDEWLKNKK